MKKNRLIFFAFFLLFTVESWGQTTIWSESFESDGNGSRYSTNISEFSVGGTDYFLRTDGSNITGESFSNIDGSYYFGAQDIDGDGATLPVTLIFDDIDISSYTSLNFKILIAEDDASDGNKDWDISDYVHIDYDIDNSGTFSNLIHIEDGGGTNTAPSIDTNFDGTGEGTEITSVFSEFSSSISGLGSTIDIKITFSLNSGDEDIAIDLLQLTGLIAGTPTLSFSSSSLNESNLNSSTITLTLSNESYVASPSASDFTLNNAPTGTTISGVSRNSNTEAVLTLSFDNTDFDSDVTNFNITAKSSALTGGSPLTSNSTTIEAFTSPTAHTNAATSTINGNATLNGSVSSNGYETTVTYEYGLTTSYGNTVTAQQSPLSNISENISVSKTINGLTIGSTYHYRIVSENSEGITLGDDQTFISITPPNAWINEIHYDNDGTDVGELVEIVIENASSYTLSDFQIDLYNGSGGASYDSKTVDNITVGDTEGNFTIYYWSLSGSMQNGNDGIALSYSGVLIPGQFISYEGAFTATDGPASGTTANNLNVSETTTSPVGYSLQLSGYGTKYSDFYWIDLIEQTPESLNKRQSFTTAPASSTWNGSTSSDWFESSNWDGSLIPGQTTNVTIADVLNQPTISTTTKINNLTINSDATLLGTENLTINGTTTVNRTLSVSKWQYLTPPVNSSTANDIEITTANNYAYIVKYNNNVAGSGTDLSSGWEYLSHDTDPLTSGTGYGVFVTENKEINFTGNLISGDQIISGISNGDSGNNPWVLIGNSALAHIDWTSISNDDDITTSAYFYDAANSQYVTITQAGGMTNTSTTLIPPMQGFFVEVDATGDGSLSIPSSALTHGNQAFYKSKTVGQNSVRLAIQKENYSDETLIYFNENATNEYEEIYDAHKLMITTPGIPQIYTVAGDDNLSINVLNQLPVSIPLNIHSTEKEELTISILNVENIDPNVYVSIYDTDKELSYDLTNCDEIRFNAIAGENENRFLLNFSIKTDNPLLESTDIKIFGVKTNVIINSSRNLNAEVSIFDITGKKIYQSKISGTHNSISLQVKTGIYLVYLKENNKTTHYKAFIQQ